MILAVSGNARVGKDTFAQRIEETLQFVRIGMADPMKRFCAEVFGFSDEQMWGDKRDDPDPRYGRIDGLSANPPARHGPLYLTPRYALQTLGTEWGRNCYQNVWIDYALRAAKRVLAGDAYSERAGVLRHCSRMKDPAPGVVFSDLRFKNEFDAVKAAGGIVVRIYREGFDGKDLAGVAMHPSEEEQRSIPDSAFHHVIRNPHGIENYHRVIDRLMAEIIQKK